MTPFRLRPSVRALRRPFSCYPELCDNASTGLVPGLADIWPNSSMTKWRDAITSLAASTKFGGSHYFRTVRRTNHRRRHSPLEWRPHFTGKFLRAPGSYEARGDHLTWALASIALTQFGYWVSDRIRPVPPRLYSRLVGHIIFFIARMCFGTRDVDFWLFVYSAKAWIPYSSVQLYCCPLGSICLVLLYSRIGEARQSPPT